MDRNRLVHNWDTPARRILDYAGLTDWSHAGVSLDIGRPRLAHRHSTRFRRRKGEAVSSPRHVRTAMSWIRAASRRNEECEPADQASGSLDERQQTRTDDDEDRSGEAGPPDARARPGVGEA